MDIYQHELDDGLGPADALDAILGGQQEGNEGATEHPETAATKQLGQEPETAR